MTTRKTHPRSKGNIPVLVYLASKLLTLPCFMRILYDGSCTQMTIVLRIAIALDSSVAEQTFVAQYDADNFTTVLDATTVQIPQARLSGFARNAVPRTNTLSLRLKQPCPLWCPRLVRLAPKPCSVSSFDELVQLAKATELDIVFDYNWLGQDLHGPVTRLSKGQDKLSGYPCEEYYVSKWEKKDWTVFSPIDATDAVATAAAPTYASGSRKRPSCSEPRAVTEPGHLSCNKRILLETPPEYTPPSPTECASSPLTNKASPKALLEENAFDYQSAAISSAVARHVPVALQQILPALLSTLLTSPPSDSHTSQLGITPLGQSLLSHFITSVQPRLEDLYQDAIWEGEQRRATADDEFLSEVEDHKLELRQIKDDNVDDFQRITTTALEDVRVEGENLADVLWDDAYNAVQNRIDRLVNTSLREHLLCANCGDSKVEVPRQSVRRFRWNWRNRGKGGYLGLGERWKTAARL